MLQELIEQQIREMRKARLKSSPQMSLGQIIEEIENIGVWDVNGEVKTVEYSFGTAIPTTLTSWRGVYAELALGYKLTGHDIHTDSNAECKADVLLEELRSAVGKQYTGWKGGEFTMSIDTPVWVDNPGNASNTAIVEIIDEGYKIVLRTDYYKY